MTTHRYPTACLALAAAMTCGAASARDKAPPAPRSSPSGWYQTLNQRGKVEIHWSPEQRRHVGSVTFRDGSIYSLREAEKLSRLERRYTWCFVIQPESRPEVREKNDFRRISGEAVRTLLVTRAPQGRLVGAIAARKLHRFARDYRLPLLSS